MSLWAFPGHGCCGCLCQRFLDMDALCVSDSVFRTWMLWVSLWAFPGHGSCGCLCQRFLDMDAVGVSDSVFRMWMLCGCICGRFLDMDAVCVFVSVSWTWILWVYICLREGSNDILACGTCMREVGLWNFSPNIDGSFRADDSDLCHGSDNGASLSKKRKTVHVSPLAFSSMFGCVVLLRSFLSVAF